MSVSLAPDWAQHFHPENGVGFASGYYVYVYESGTTDYKVSYTDPSQTSVHTQPIVLNSQGRYPGKGLYLVDDEAYTLVFSKELLPGGTPIHSVDEVYGVGTGGGDVDISLPSQTVLGNISAGTTDGYPVDIESDIDTADDANIPNVELVRNALDEKLDNSGDNTYTGNLDIDGSLTVNGEPIDTKKVKVSSNDSTEGFLEDKIVGAGDASVTTISEGGDEKIQIEVTIPEEDYRTKVDAEDTDPGYLIDKIAAGAGITIDDGGDEIIISAFLQNETEMAAISLYKDAGGDFSFTPAYPFDMTGVSYNMDNLSDNETFTIASSKIASVDGGLYLITAQSTSSITDGSYADMVLVQYDSSDVELNRVRMRIENTTSDSDEENHNVAEAVFKLSAGDYVQFGYENYTGTIYLYDVTYSAIRLTATTPDGTGDAPYLTRWIAPNKLGQSSLKENVGNIWTSSAADNDPTFIGNCYDNIIIASNQAVIDNASGNTIIGSYPTAVNTINGGGASNLILGKDNTCASANTQYMLGNDNSSSNGAEGITIGYGNTHDANGETIVIGQNNDVSSCSVITVMGSENTNIVGGGEGVLIGNHNDSIIMGPVTAIVNNSTAGTQIGGDRVIIAADMDLSTIPGGKGVVIGTGDEAGVGSSWTQIMGEVLDNDGNHPTDGQFLTSNADGALEWHPDINMYDAVVHSEAEWIAAMESDTVSTIFVDTDDYFQTQDVTVGNIAKAIFSNRYKLNIGKTYTFQAQARFYTPVDTIGDTLILDGSASIYMTTLTSGQPTDVEVDTGVTLYYEYFNGGLGYASIGGTGTAEQLFWWNTNKNVAGIEKQGFPIDDTDAVMSIDEGTRTFSVTPSGTKFSFYIAGKQIIKTSVQSVTWADTQGRHFFYFDEDGVLQTTDTFTYDLVLDPSAYCSYIYWDVDAQEATLFTNQKHTDQFPARLIQTQDMVTGAEYAAGLGLTDLVVDANGSLDAHAQFGVDGGDIVDSDIITEITTKVSTQGFGVFYKDENDDVRRIVNSGFSVLTDIDAGIGSTGRLIYNDWGDAVTPLKVVPNGDYVLCHVFAIQNVNQTERIIAVLGNAYYSNEPQAKTGAETEMISIIEGYSLGIGGDLVPIATVIFQTNDSYTNTVKARVIAPDDGDYIDWRRTRALGTSGSTAEQYWSRDTSGADPILRPVNDGDWLTTQVLVLEEPDTEPNHAEGLLYYDSGAHSIQLDGETTGTSLSLGREQWCRAYNNTGAEIANGTVVYCQQGADESGYVVAQVALANANSKVTCTFVGIATETIANGDYGEVTISGAVQGINTSSWSNGDILYVSTTSGQMTNIAPAYPNFECKVGKVLASSTTDGVIHVSPDVDPPVGGGGAVQLGIETFPISLITDLYSNNLGSSNALYLSTLVFPTANMTVNYMSCFVTQTGANQGTRLGIYTPGASDTLIGQTVYKSDAFTIGVNTLAMTSPVTLTAGTPYLFAIQSSSNGTQFGYKSDGITTNRPNHLAAYDGFNPANPSAGMESPSARTQSGYRIWLSAS